MNRTVLSILPCVFGALASPAFATCPMNQFSLNTTPSWSSLPADSLSGTNANARYNVPLGTLEAIAGCSESCGGSAAVFVEDDFTVTGLPSGTPVPLVAHFLLGDLSQNSAAYSTATIWDYTNATSVSTNGPKSNYDLTLAVAAVAGQAFRLHFGVNCGGSGVISLANGAFSFTGLPPGTVLTSCQGYTLGGSVPAQATSWGSVKSLYR